MAGAGWGAVLSCAGLLEVDSVLPALPTCRVPCGCGCAPCGVRPCARVPVRVAVSRGGSVLRQPF